MNDSNKKNLVYFESESMRGLFETMATWQDVNAKRLLSASIQQDGPMYCCIALTNPTEVVICHGTFGYQADVGMNGRLKVEV